MRDVGNCDLTPQACWESLVPWNPIQSKFCVLGLNCSTLCLAMVTSSIGPYVVAYRGPVRMRQVPSNGPSLTFNQTDNLARSETTASCGGSSLHTEAASVTECRPETVHRMLLHTTDQRQQLIACANVSSASANQTPSQGILKL